MKINEPLSTTPNSKRKCLSKQVCSNKVFRELHKDSLGMSQCPGEPAFEHNSTVPTFLCGTYVD